MNRLKKVFKKRLEAGQKLFLPYLCAGDPDLETSRELVLTVDENGADVLEYGFPFSDPVADGPTVQKAGLRSFDSGVSLTKVFATVSDLRSETELPLVMMTYYNPVLKRGEDWFLEHTSEAGFDAILVVDLPPEEGLEFYQRAADYELETILLATPTTPPERVRELSQLATGFIYYVMVTGVTGARTGYDTKLAERLQVAREACEIPLVAGFGVSNYEMIAPYLDYVDGVVTGSALIQKIEDNLGEPDKIKSEVEQFVRNLAEPLHS